MTLRPWRHAALFMAVGTLVATALPVTAVAAPTPPDTHTPSSAAPVLDPSSGALQTVPLRGSTRSFGSLPAMPAAPWDTEDAHAGLVPVVYSEELEVDPFRLAAVTWVGEGDVTAWVRTRQDGEWSQWYELPHGDDHAPDPDSAEGADVRNGTDPLLVPSSDAVQVRVDAPRGRAATDLRLDLIDPGLSSAASPPDAEIQTEPSASVAAARPSIVTRAQWGADESLRGTPPQYGQVNGAFVHHTVNANDYSEAEVPALIRSIYLYHVQSRGWSDIGYNFIIDRFGRIWEGRYGGMDRAVIGAHTLGYNDDAFAASALGNYEDATPTNAMLSAYARLFAWKFSVHGVNPLARVNYDGESWPAVAGHRDAASTACPGARLYARLATIRSGVLREMNIGGDATHGRDFDGNGRADLVARQRSDASLWFWGGLGSATFDRRDRLGTGWSAFNALVLPGDWDGDGRDDVIARRRADASLWLYPGARGGNLGPPLVIGRGWRSVSAIVAPGDWDRDGAADLIARRTNGELWLYPGNGSGRFGTPRPIGSGWAGMTAIVGPGDWNSDGIVDLVARRSNGELWLYPGNGRDGFGKARRIGTGWNSVAGIVGSGDIDGDRVLDLLAWRPNGVMLLYPGIGTGGFRTVREIGTGWNAYDLRS
ncbi:FG-GAP-like repeat-containing protein [Jiangella alkaliphila]|uniref:Repeat domain-containing protein n=1 Tax=Jiangella alkaliphila TaxID=419479 RepID=A0A1H2LZW4_9ACTN|nr:FG-GAP-like repeat-containing protein [Jiangella alkaliphila]SDU86543.1 Repeat domain-containing protein [Jiangella alkaliphila]